MSSTLQTVGRKFGNERGIAEAEGCALGEDGMSWEDQEEDESIESHATSLEEMEKISICGCGLTRVLPLNLRN